MNLLTAWNEAQPIIKNAIGNTAYDTWFSSIQIKQNHSNTLQFICPDDFFKNWIIDHYKTILEKAFLDLNITNILFDFSVDLSPVETIPTEETLPAPFLPKAQSFAVLPLNHNFTFENFVVGPSNRFASAASIAVAESPAKAYNPFFIYGQVGLGKTHLLQAITYRIQRLHPTLKICYMSSETFTNELIFSIQHKATAEFRKKYRDIDVLLIDDIQFIAGKEATQEEFFHTFNTLHNSHKQIIITSDRPPKEISKLEERLRSRFEWGLITDIQPPDFETRVAILKKKSEKEPTVIPNDVIFYIAEQIKTNIRELEGALIRVVAYSKLDDHPVTLSLAQKILKNMVKETNKIITIEMIQKHVSEFYQLSISELKSKKRNKNIVTPRQIAMFLCRQLTTLSFPEIGGAFGGKDHTTVLHSCKKMENQIKDDIQLKHIIDELTKVLKT